MDEERDRRSAAPSGSSRAAPRTRVRLRRWAWRCGLLLLLAVGMLALPLALPTRVVPPPRPAEPVSVFLLDYGRTPALVLPLADGRMREYVYGDWRYYAVRDTRLRAAAAALFWPTRGTIGYRTLEGPATPESIRRQIDLVIQEMHEIPVERAAADRLVARLDALIEERQEHALFQPEFNRHFVPHPKNYTYFHNSNHRVAAWLRELGCRTHGPAFYSRWRVQ